MAYLTDRKRAMGKGSAKAGTEHHWHMIVTSCALLILVPLFIFTFGAALGGTYEETVAYYSRPWPAIIAALTVLVGMIHFKSGVQTLIEDYVHGTVGKALIIGTICLSYFLAAAGLWAIVRLAI